nr:xylulose kinase-1 [Tanacetum cinerariifolium]
MVAYLNKSNASEGFNQVIDFHNGSHIKYALTINPTIYVSCIKQFWNTVFVKQSNDVTRLQALVDKKKVLITEAAIRDVLRLDDAKGVDCLPNEEIFAELARMGYEKLSTKLKFYKAFFSSQYQVMKKRPQTEAQAQRNMITYLKNFVGFILDYFKGMYYDDIRPIFKAKFNTNIEFLLKSKEQIEEEENRAIESINKTPAQKAAKRRKLNDEVKEVEDIKQHLEIVPDEDNDVYTEATPLARKAPVVDYQIIQLNNKPRYKIIRADGTHQLYSNVCKTRWTRSNLEESKECPWSSKALELMLPWILKKNTKCFNAAGEELSAAKQKVDVVR